MYVIRTSEYDGKSYKKKKNSRAGERGYSPPALSSIYIFFIFQDDVYLTRPIKTLAILLGMIILYVTPNHEIYSWPLVVGILETIQTAERW